MSLLNRSGIRRSGDEYQDLFGLEVAIDWLEHPERYEWIRFEADDFAGSLDDVTALRCDDAFLARQIKWTSNTGENTLSWDWLLDKDPNKPRQKCLLEKWSSSLSSLSQRHTCHEASVCTNREIDSAFAACLDESGRVDLSIVPDDTRDLISAYFESAENMSDFFSAFQFFANHPSYSAKREALFKRFSALVGDEYGFNSLLEKIREWGKLKDKHITFIELRNAAQWNVLDDLFQGFRIPENYVLPDDNFHDFFKARIIEEKRPVSMLRGSPGLGKSTYLSYLKGDLEKQNVPVIRHHYFLSQDDTSGDRYSWSIVSQSLMSQIQKHYSDNLGDLANENPDPNNVRKWIERCGSSSRDTNNPFVIIIDGLDHVYRDRGTSDPLLGIVDHLLPVPDNVVLILATRDVDRSYFPNSILDAVPTDLWVELPFMNLVAVRRWTELNASLIGVSENEHNAEYRLDLIAESLFEKSNGYPLHVTYTLQTLLDTEQPVNDTTISSLPACPNNDIKQYYKNLMRTLDESGLIMIHILCACGFKWPLGALSECLSGERYGTIAEISQIESKVRHLLRRDLMGLSVYHVSLQEYVCSLPEHGRAVQQAYTFIIDWLENCAPELWRWSYLWITQHKSGDSTPIIDGPTEEWLSDALLKGYPLYQIEEILQFAAWAALDNDNLVRTLQLNLMSDYARSAHEYQTNGLERLLFCQLQFGWSDISLHKRLLSEPHELSDKELTMCAEAYSELGQVENVELFKDFFEKEYINNPSSDSNRSINDQWSSSCYLDIIGSLKLQDAERLLNWTRRYDGDGKDLTTHLYRLVSLNATESLQNIAKFDLRSEEARVTARALLKLAWSQSINISSWQLCRSICRTPLMQVRYFLEGAPVSAAPTPLPDGKAFSKSRTELYGEQPELVARV